MLINGSEYDFFILSVIWGLLIDRGGVKLNRKHWNLKNSKLLQLVLEGEVD